MSRLEKLSSMRDSIAVNLSRSISVEASKSVSWFPSISSLFCLFRFGVGLSVELELDERSPHFNMGTSSKTTDVSVIGCVDVKKTSPVSVERTQMARYDSSQLRNHRA